MLRKRTVDGAATPAAAQLLAGAFGSSYPLVWEMLQADRYPDGTSRRTSTLTLFVDDGQVKVCLNDRDNGLTAWSAASEALEAILSLERALTNDTAVWRAAPGSSGKRRK